MKRTRGCRGRRSSRPAGPKCRSRRAPERRGRLRGSTTPQEQPGEQKNDTVRERRVDHFTTERGTGCRIGFRTERTQKHETSVSRNQQSQKKTKSKKISEHLKKYANVLLTLPLQCCVFGKHHSIAMSQHTTRNDKSEGWIMRNAKQVVRISLKKISKKTQAAKEFQTMKDVRLTFCFKQER